MEFALVMGSEADEDAQGLEPKLARRFDRFGDNAFTGYDYEVLLEEVGLHLKAQHKKTSKWPMLGVVGSMRFQG